MRCILLLVASSSINQAMLIQSYLYPTACITSFLLGDITLQFPIPFVCLLVHDSSLPFPLLPPLSPPPWPIPLALSPPLPLFSSPLLSPISQALGSFTDSVKSRLSATPQLERVGLTSEAERLKHHLDSITAFAVRAAQEDTPTLERAARDFAYSLAHIYTGTSCSSLLPPTCHDLSSCTLVAYAG